MAKAPRYEAFEPQTPVRAAGRSILRSLSRQVAEQAPGVIVGADPESTHDMRVAIRRLRSAIDTFGAYEGGREFTRFARAARRLGRRLGAVRDADVQLIVLRRALDAAEPGLREGIAFAVDTLTERRQLDLARVAPAFEKFEVLRTAL